MGLGSPSQWGGCGIFPLAMGQTMDANGYTGRTVISSTHQYADGTNAGLWFYLTDRLDSVRDVVNSSGANKDHLDVKTAEKVWADRSKAGA